MKRIHCIGIGGTGISAIASLLLERGWQVSGSDRNDSPYFRQLSAKGAITALGPQPQLALQAELVLRSSAVRDDHPEVLAAQKAGISVLKRADFLPELIGEDACLAVAGSHGKTTTTAMLVRVLEGLGQDPSFIIGAQIKDLHSNAHAGTQALFVIEADEYDYMFLGLHPRVAIVTNIEHDHPDCFPTEAIYREAFARFLAQVRPDGTALLCAEDPGIQKLLAENSFTGLQPLRYGFSNDCEYQACNPLYETEQSSFDLIYHRKDAMAENLGRFSLAIPGRHNILNATASLAGAHQMGFALSASCDSLANFSGAERRFDTVAEENGFVLINDYGHHPTQIALTIQAARQRYPKSKIWAVWEPHTYSRTISMEARFTTALQEADESIILPIYAAREADCGYTPASIVEALRPQMAHYFENFDEASDYLSFHLSGNDCIIVFSAGKGPEFCQSLLLACAKSTKERHEQ